MQKSLGPTPLAQKLASALDGRSQGCYDLRLPSAELSRFAAAMVEQVLNAHVKDPDARRELIDRIENYAATNAAFAFVDVDPMREPGDQFRREHELITEIFAGKNARRLELGTYKTFPDAVVQQIVAAEGLSQFIRLDFSPEYSPELVADCAAIPLKDGSVDMVCSNSLFEHIAHPHRAIAEGFRVLSPGGLMMTTVPFLFTLHGCPADYLRYTPQFLEQISYEAGFARVVCFTEEYSGAYYTMHAASKSVIAGMSLHPDVAQATRVLHHNLMALLFMLIPLDQYFINRANNLFTSVRCIAYKHGEFAPRPEPARHGDFVLRNLELLRCPATGLDLRREEDALVTVDGSRRYRVRGKSIDFVNPVDGTCSQGAQTD